MKGSEKYAGQSIFEVIVALGVASLVLVAIVAGASVSNRNSTFSRDNSQASGLASDTSEWLRGNRDAGWAAFVARAGTTSTPNYYCFDTNGNWVAGSSSCTACSAFVPGTFFKRVVSLAKQSGADIVDTSVTVCWNDPQGYHEAALASSLSKR